MYNFTLKQIQNWHSQLWSSHQRCPIKMLFLKNLQYSQENTCLSLIKFNNFIKKRLQRRCFLFQYCKIFKTLILNMIYLFFEHVFLRIMFWRIYANGCFCQWNFHKVPPKLWVTATCCWAPLRSEAATGGVF